MYDDVLFPTDGSDPTRRALTHALEMAGQYDATLHVLSVVPEDPYRTDEGEAAALDSAERAIDAAVSRAEPDLDTTTEVRHGIPHEEILAYAADREVDLIVMGTHGRTGVGRALLGSVAERVIKSASVPVVTVRATDEPDVSGAEDAERIAVEELRDRGYGDATVVKGPHRTTGTWIVPVEGEGVSAHVHVDADSGAARVARLDEEE